MEAFSQTKRRGTLAASLLVAGSAAWAQPVVPSGLDAELEPRRALQRQMQQQQRLQEEQEQRQRQATQALEKEQTQAPASHGDAPLPENEAPCFPIRQVRLTGPAGAPVPAALLRGLPQALGQRTETRAGRTHTVMDAPEGRCLGAQGVNIVLARAQNHLIARGYITSRVLAPEQDLKQGELTLSVIPGYLADLRLAAPESTAEQAHPQTAAASATSATELPLRVRTALPSKPGDLLNLRDIEQALENMNRVPSADADIQIAPGRQQGQITSGQSDLIVRYTRQRPVRASLSLDDSGTDSTGKYQASASLSVDNPLRLNDMFYVSYTRALGGGNPQTRGSRGTDAYNVHYSIPFGYWLLSGGFSKNNYHQTVAGAVQNYRYSGDSQSAEIALGRVLYRDASRKTSLTLKGWGRSSHNYIDEVEIDVQRRRTAGWAVQLNHRQYFGATSLDITLGYKRGTGAFNARPAPEELFDEGTSRFALATADVQLNAPFQLGAQRLRWNSQLRVQHNFTRLTVQDQFSIGGRYTVRGFDGESSLMAERGWLLRNELGWMLGQSAQEAYLGIDHGRVGGPGSQWLPGKSLTGAVIGLRGQAPGWAHGLSYDVFVGTPVRKPAGFKTAKHAAGFSVNWTF